MRKPYLQFIGEVLKLNPVFVVGSGSSAGAGISGMGALADYLLRHVDAAGFEAEERRRWSLLAERIASQGQGLEEALQAAGDGLTRRMTAEIVQRTWCCIAGDEQDFPLRLACGDDPTGFVRLFRAFAQSTHKVVHMITTNYDHLIEWSASSAQWRVWDGFPEGSIGQPLSSAALDEQMRRTVRAGKRLQAETLQHVRVYKPHGSLSWFKFPDGRIKSVAGITAHHLPMLRKVNIAPVIVTPGLSKYLETHFEPYAGVLSEMQRALSQARALLFLGFGFNDIHIQGSFQSVLGSGSIPKLVLARRLSPAFQRLAAGNGIRNYVAVEAAEAGSRVQSDRFPAFEAREEEHWTLKGLLNLVWGVERADELRSVSYDGGL